MESLKFTIRDGLAYVWVVSEGMMVGVTNKGRWWAGDGDMKMIGV